ncbi:radical SAM protein, partial [Patescibacteria group bacterium]
MNIVIKTLGCKANRYESDKIQDKFGDHFNVVDIQTNQPKHADVIIVNTCTVTHVADRKSRQAISNLKKQYPAAKVIVFGCGANTDREGYKDLPNVDYVIQEPQKLYDLLEELSGQFENTCETESFGENRTRTLIKIQDGCNNFCSYCIIPYARGREKSRPLEEIIKEINEKCEKGYKEVVLTGINIGMWKENEKDLADLISDILDKTTIARLRLSSIEPQNFSKRFLELFSNPRFCPHLHISLQSGSDTILKSMRR